MARRNLLIGASVLAFAGGSAGAETTFFGTNQSTVVQTGFGNSANVNNKAPGNDDNASTVTQNGINNAASVEQVGDLNISRARQVGNDGKITHRQNGNRNTADSEQTGNDHSSTLTQQGNDNFGTAIQANGDRNSSTIDQARAFINGTRARVTQRGSDNSSNVTQEGSQQAATVVQGTASLFGNGNRSGISQRQSGQTAELFQLEGSTAAGNVSSILQENRITGGGGFNSNNRASVAMRGFGNESAVAQNGDNLLARVSMLGGGSASGAQTDTESGRTQGNRSSVTQTGRALTALVSAGSSLSGEGQGNLNTVEQTSVVEPGEIRASHRAVVWQMGAFDTNLIRQADRSTTRPVQQPINYSDGTRGRAVADVAQKGGRGSVEVHQFADNTARVTQGFGSRSGVRIEQVDAGDFEVSIASVPGSTLRAFNRAVVAQNGDNNSVDLAQDSVNANAVVFQMRASSFNSVIIAQGVQGPETLDPNNPTPIRGETFNLSAQVSQGGSRNSADIGQWGTNLQATVQQLGSGSADMLNRVHVRQRGQANRATARQGAGAGPSASTDPASGQSGDEFFFPGGARSAEIAIIQSNFGNSASVEQHGRGQFGRIEQSGARNTASILQDVAATNATAVIRQSGNDNSYSITQ
ncbi:MAG: hypothetical protein M3Q08_14335, partial [Pseudomonadota bacterium]|nr:hypothetical protein [Pseudomonadota bacterium]